PIGMRQNVVAADLAPGLDLTTVGHSPMKERVVPRDPRSAARWFDMLEKRREAADDAAFVQRSRDALEVVDGKAGLGGAAGPRVVANLLHGKLALERLEHPPIQLAQLDDVGIDDDSGLIALASGLDATAAYVAHAKGEKAFRWHHLVRVGADALHQE